MASNWHTHVVKTSAWAGSARGASLEGRWQRRIDLLKILNESAPEIHLGLVTGDLTIDEFAGWGSGDLPLLASGISGEGTSTGGYSGFDDPEYLAYSISGATGASFYSGYAQGGTYSVQQLAEAYWVEITGARITFEE